MATEDAVLLAGMADYSSAEQPSVQLSDVMSSGADSLGEFIEGGRGYFFGGADVVGEPGISADLRDSVLADIGKDPIGSARKASDWADEQLLAAFRGDAEAARNSADMASFVDQSGVSDALSAISSARLAYERPSEQLGGHLFDVGISSLAAAVPLVGSGFAKRIIKGAPEVADVAKAAPTEPVPVFESVLERVVSDKMPNKVGVNDVEKFLMGKGAKRDELTDTKVYDFIETAKASGKKSISKDDLIRHLEDNKVQIEEVRLGGDPEALKPFRKAVQKAHVPVRKAVKAFRKRLSGDGIHTSPDLLHRLEDNIDVVNEPFRLEIVDLARQVRSAEDLAHQKIFSLNRGRPFGQAIPDQLTDEAQEVADFFRNRVLGPGGKGLSSEFDALTIEDQMLEIEEAFSKVNDLYTVKRKLLPGRAAGPDRNFIFAVAHPKKHSQKALNSVSNAFKSTQELKNSDDFKKYESARRDFDLERAKLPENVATYKTYTVPGGTDYQELLLVAPGVLKLDKKFYDWYETSKPVSAPALHQRPGRRAVPFNELDSYSKEDVYQLYEIEYPGSRPKKFTGSHHPNFPNVMVHIRFKTRIDSKGRRILFVEEIQSDWHQAGLKRGYTVQENKAIVAELEEKVRLAKRQVEIRASDALRRGSVQGFEYDFDILTESLKYAKYGPVVGSPPLKDTKEWAGLAVKRIFRLAADEGYDGVAFTTGKDIQAVSGGKIAGQEYFYDKLLPSLAKSETKAKRSNTLIDIEPDNPDRHAAEQLFPFFELTKEVKDKVIQPQKLYSLALPGIAVGAAAAGEEELSAAAALGAIGMGGMALYRGAKGARGAARAADLKVPTETSAYEGQQKVGKVLFDSKDGMGAVPNNRNVAYKGFVAWMKPRDFLGLNPERAAKHAADTVKAVTKAIDEGKPIGPPFLSVKLVKEGENAGSFQVFNHEGRGRMAAINDIDPDTPVPVHIFGRGVIDRGRDITPKMMEDLVDPGSKVRLLPDKKVAEGKEVTPDAAWHVPDSDDYDPNYLPVGKTYRAADVAKPPAAAGAKTVDDVEEAGKVPGDEAGKVLGIKDLNKAGFESKLKELKTGKEAAKFLAASAESAADRMIAFRIIPHLDDVTITVVNHGDRAPIRLARGLSVGTSKISTETKGAEVFLRGAEFDLNGIDAETVLHELLHAATQRRINDGLLVANKGTELSKAVVELNDLTKVVIKEWKAAGHPVIAGSLNMDELLAWGLSNKEFQGWLKTVKIGDQTAFNKFVQVIADLLGIPRGEVNALSEVLRLTDDILRAPIEDLPKTRYLGKAGEGVRGTATATMATKPPPAADVATAAAKIDTPEFKRWFGDSKVVDEAGEPLVVYHGVAHSKGFESFDVERAGSASLDSGWYGKGFYFSDDPSIASAYAGGGLDSRKILDLTDEAGFAPTSGTGSIAPVYLSLRNPYDVGPKPFGVRGLVRAGERLPDDIHDAVVAKAGFDPSATKNPFIAGESKTGEAGAEIIRQHLIDGGTYAADSIEFRVKSYLENPGGFWFRLISDVSSEAMTKALKADGFDGILQKEANAGTITLPWADWGVRTTNDAEKLFSEAMTSVLKEQGYDGVVAGLSGGKKEYLVFDPTQIKSVKNVGTFDPKDPRILWGAGLGAAGAAKASKLDDETGNPFGDDYEPLKADVTDYVADFQELSDEDFSLDELDRQSDMIVAEYSSLSDEEKLGRRGGILVEWYDEVSDQISAASQAESAGEYERFLRGPEAYLPAGGSGTDDLRGFVQVGLAPRVDRSLIERGLVEDAQRARLAESLEQGSPMVDLYGRFGKLNRYLFSKARHYGEPVGTVQLSSGDKLVLSGDRENLDRLSRSGLITDLLYRELLGSVKLLPFGG